MMLFWLWWWCGGRRFLRGLGQQIILPDGDANWFNNPQYRWEEARQAEEPHVPVVSLLVA